MRNASGDIVPPYGSVKPPAAEGTRALPECRKPWPKRPHLAARAEGVRGSPLPPFGWWLPFAGWEKVVGRRAGRRSAAPAPAWFRTNDMDAAAADILTRHSVPRHRLTVHDYHRLGEAGVLDEDDRVELLEGQLVDMSPIGPRHAFVIDLLNRILVSAVGDRGWVRVQNPVVLDDESEPQPDIVVARPSAGGYRGAHPRPDDVLLLIEVADSSFEFDSGAKRELYARAGIREFWIVDLTTNRVLVHRTPSGGSYADTRPVGSSGALQIEALPDIMIPAATLLV